MEQTRFSNQVVLFLVSLLLFFGSAFARNDAMPVILARDLPPEARQTIALIRQGGPFPYAKDGTVFNNFEKLLPRQPRGYYREYTVRTPRVRHRGARRIVVGGKPEVSSEYYYTNDHYETFRRIQQ